MKKYLYLFFILLVSCNKNFQDDNKRNGLSEKTNYISIAKDHFELDSSGVGKFREITNSLDINWQNATLFINSNKQLSLSAPFLNLLETRKRFEIGIELDSNAQKIKNYYLLEYDPDDKYFMENKGKSSYLKFTGNVRYHSPLGQLIKVDSIKDGVFQNNIFIYNNSPLKKGKASSSLKGGAGEAGDWLEAWTNYQYRVICPLCHAHYDDLEIEFFQKCTRCGHCYKNCNSGSSSGWGTVGPITGGEAGGTGGGGSGSPPVNKFNKKNPCANKNELNYRKNNSKILAKNNEIKNLTLNEGSGKGFEHGYNTYVNLNNGNVTKFTGVEVGSKTETGQQVPSHEGWNWLPNNQVEATVDYVHTHPFESAPSSTDVFSGIEIYMATTNANHTALSPAQKEVYLSYHSINVMTTNHDYAITITDPAKWVSRYVNRKADFEKFRDMSTKYNESGYDWHTAQELALLDLYGDMIQLYRSDVGANDFKPVNVKIDPKNFRKIISNINC